jgi:DNA-binding NarL/FixJ family response regulator
MTNVRVVLADDHPVVLAGVRTLLLATPDITVVGEANTGRDALQVIGETRPDVAVIDISMPTVNGIELAKDVCGRFGSVKLLALTVHEDRAYVQRMLQAGVRGYLLKRTAAEELVRAIRAVGAGGIYLDPAVADKALPDAAAKGVARGNHSCLSPREEDVLRLTAQGFNNKEIARHLDVGSKSIETYKARAILKLNLHTRADIVRYGMEQGWLDELGRS